MQEDVFQNFHIRFIKILGKHFLYENKLLKNEENDFCRENIENKFYK